MKEIMISTTEDRVIFSVGGEEYFLVLSRFLEILKADGEAIKNEAERIARRFDPLKRLETVCGIDVLRDKELSLREIADWFDVSEALLTEFVWTQRDYLAGQRADPSYVPMYDKLKADPRLIGNGGPDRPSRRPHLPGPPAPPPNPIGGPGNPGPFGHRG